MLRTTLRSAAALLTLLCVGVFAADRAPTEPPFASISTLSDDDKAAINAYLTSQLQAGGYPSLAVGIVRDETLAFATAVGVADRAASRAAAPDTIYAIGSITKVFTATLMMDLRDDGVISLNDPVHLHIPEITRGPAGPEQKPAITLSRLACHTSGLPRLPGNLTPRATPLGTDPYGGYTAEQLIAGLQRIKLQSPPGARSSYSNLGAALLGHTLERAARQPFADLLRERLTAPLGMTDTSVGWSGVDRARLAIGYDADDAAKPAVEWDLGVLAPAGAIMSTVPDLAKFMAMQMRALRDPAPDEAPLPVAAASLCEMIATQPRKPGDDGLHGIGWVVADHKSLGRVVWHNGGMAGHMSYLAFIPDKRVGIIVLTNRGGQGVEMIGVWLLERLLAAPPMLAQ